MKETKERLRYGGFAEKEGFKPRVSDALVTLESKRPLIVVVTK